MLATNDRSISVLSMAEDNLVYILYDLTDLLLQHKQPLKNFASLFHRLCIAALE